MSQAEYEALRSNAKVLEADGHGDKVLLLTDGRIMKLFRVRHTISSARWYPYSRRFAKNALLLRRNAIDTVGEIELFKLPSMQRTGVLYQPLPGETLRRLGMAGELTLADCKQAGEFIALLHTKGILFRSIHLGNVVKQPNGELGLIDIADLSRQSGPLSKSQRLRNFRHLFRPPEDHAYLDAPRKTALIDGYLEYAGPRFASRPGFREEIATIAKLAC